MKVRSIEWLKKEEVVEKRFYICKDSDLQHALDPEFENWIVGDSRKRYSVEMGDNLKTDEDGFTYAGTPMERKTDNPDPFPFLSPIYTRWRCSWKNVTAVYQGEGGGAWVYIFTKP